MQEFLTDRDDDENNSSPVDLKVNVNALATSPLLNANRLGSPSRQRDRHDFLEEERERGRSVRIRRTEDKHEQKHRQVFLSI